LSIRFVPSDLRAAIALLAGVTFGAGLAVAQMIDPRKVLGFLDIAGAWDASLLFVLGGAVLLSAVAFRWVLRRPAPVLDDRFHISARTAIDAPVLLGSALFGVGWGLAGYCPGPAIASIVFGNAEVLWFVPAMLVGAALQRWQWRSVQDKALPVGTEPRSQG
jgi:uncharacterized protein